MNTCLILSHLSGSKSGDVEEFARRDSVLIGRGTDNDVALDAFNDSTVSAHHAEIRREQSGFVLYDMGSLNGTYLNGQAVRRAPLETGDEIGLGRRGPRLLFGMRASDAAARPAAVPMRRVDLDRSPPSTLREEMPGALDADDDQPGDEEPGSGDWLIVLALAAIGFAALVYAIVS